MLKAFGVKVSEADIKKVEELIPRIPHLTQEVARKIDTTLDRIERGFRSIEARLDAIEVKLGVKPGGHPDA